MFISSFEKGCEQIEDKFQIKYFFASFIEYFFQFIQYVLVF
jgi:hypothetical protein